MKNKYEAKFPAVDVVGLRTQLAGLGAVQTFPRTLLTRKIFESDVLEGARWVRLPTSSPSSGTRLRRSPVRQP